MAGEKLEFVRRTSGTVKKPQRIGSGWRVVVSETSCSSTARDGWKLGLSRSKKSSRDFFTNDSGSSPVRLRFITSDDGFQKSSRRSRKSVEDSRRHFVESHFVSLESSTSGLRLLAVPSRFFASKARSFASDARPLASDARSFASGARFGGDGRRRIAGNRGVPASGRGLATACAARRIAHHGTETAEH